MSKFEFIPLSDIGLVLVKREDGHFTFIISSDNVNDIGTTFLTLQQALDIASLFH